MSDSSAGIIARNVYTALKSNPSYRLLYFDYNNINEWVKVETEILITLVESFDLARWFFKPKFSYVFVVNQHPMQRLSILKEARRKKLPRNALSGTDGIYQPVKSLTKFNGIIYVGNHITAESYQKFYKRINLHQTFYHSQFNGLENTQESFRKSSDFNVLILMSEISFRKGFDVVCDLIKTCNLNALDIRFSIVGDSKSKYWRKILNDIVTMYPNVNYYGWLNNKSDDFKELISQMNLAIFPSREEGMLGALIECIEIGILSMHTIDCGIISSSDLLRINIHDIDDFFQKIQSLRYLDESSRVSILTDQKKQLQNQMEGSKSIGEILAICLNDLPNTKSKLNKLSVMKEISPESISYYPQLYLDRLKILFLSKYKKKFFLIVSKVIFKRFLI